MTEQNERWPEQYLPILDKMMLLAREIEKLSCPINSGEPKVHEA